MPGGACAPERDATSRFPSDRVAGRRRGCQLANRGDSPRPQRRAGTDTEPLGAADREPAVKLGAHRRTEAVARARDLGLLAPSPMRCAGQPRPAVLCPGPRCLAWMSRRLGRLGLSALGGVSPRLAGATPTVSSSHSGICRDPTAATAATPAATPAADHLITPIGCGRRAPPSSVNSAVREIMIMYLSCASGQTVEPSRG